MKTNEQKIYLTFRKQKNDIDPSARSEGPLSNEKDSD